MLVCESQVSDILQGSEETPILSQTELAMLTKHRAASL